MTVILGLLFIFLMSWWVGGLFQSLIARKYEKKYEK